uniref:Uncharacterized protein n=1 Tax=Oryza punctata TaxID=4537 RepID=A0A0E0LD12_ORYPU
MEAAKQRPPRMATHDGGGSRALMLSQRRRAANPTHEPTARIAAETPGSLLTSAATATTGGEAAHLAAALGGSENLSSRDSRITH